MKNILLCVIILLSHLAALTAQDQAPEKLSLIQKLADQNIQSTPWDDGQWWDEEDFATFLKKYLHEMQNPHARFKRSCAYKLLKKADWKNKKAILDDTALWNDLDLFVGRNNKSSYVAAKLDRTQTELGKTALYALLAQPVSDINIIAQRQAIIRHLLDNQTLYGTLDALLKNIAQAEPVILTLFNQNILRNSGRFCYFQNILSPANKSSLALQARSIFDHGLRSYCAVVAGMATVVLGAYGLSQLISAENVWLNQKAQEYKDDAGWLVRRLWPLLSHPLMRGVLALTGSALCAGACYEEVNWEHGCTTLELMLQTITITVASMMNSLLEISRSLKQYPEIVNIDDFQPLFELEKRVDEKSGDCAELFELLSSDTLQGEASIFSLQGRALRAFKLFDELKESFVSTMVAGAKLDAYMSCVRLLKTSIDSRAFFTFAQFCDRETPCIQAEGLWHPFINPEHVIAHDYALGVDEAARTMIITGPNEGGKSTILKEVALALVMAHSIGIVPAKNFITTPFTTITTYLTVADDTASGESLFRASAIRAAQLLDKIENAGHKEFAFVAFDELFSGTSPEEGEAAAYSVVRGIGQSPYVISMVATHFPLLTSLAYESSNFANYKVSIQVQPDGSIAYPYQLEQGISDQHVALHVLRSQGISHRFLDDAIERLTLLSHA